MGAVRKTSLGCDGYARRLGAHALPLLWACTLVCCQTRGSARAIWDKVMPAALGGDPVNVNSGLPGNTERSLLQRHHHRDGNYYQHWLALKDRRRKQQYRHRYPSPDWIGSGYVVDTFIANYLMTVTYAMATQLHAPMAASWGRT